MLEFFLDLKMQYACLFVLVTLTYTCWKEGAYLDKRSGKKNCNAIFDAMLSVANVTVLFDGITAATANRLDTVPFWLNAALHLVFFAGLQVFFFLFLLYILSKTDGLPQTRAKKVLLCVPQTIALIVTAACIGSIEFVVGKSQNYSNGLSAEVTFLMIFGCCVFALSHTIRKIRYFERRKKISFVYWLGTCLFFFVIQSIFRETLLSALGVTMIVFVAYEWQESPILLKLEYFTEEAVTSFATLIESKDGSTGGHVKRTSRYAEIIATELMHHGIYARILTKDYLKSLKNAAPMHDIGKIAIPDYVLQKPGRFTAEEYEIMKGHSEKGGKIIKETFGHFEDEDYEKIAFEVATYHHEKWNGKGYPNGLCKEEIPLCARIMAVADVFDAVSAKRCYRDALPLDECFAIIADGRGSDFDPVVVDAFFAQKDEVVKVYKALQGAE